MSEHEIMWIGRKPSSEQTGPVETEQPEYAEAVVAACAAAGCEVTRYVAARGAFGSWLVELQLHDGPGRLIWNGKDGELSVEAQRPPSAWDPRGTARPEARDLPALLAAARSLLEAPEMGNR